MFIIGLSLGVALISLSIKKKIVSVPCVLALLSPFAKLPNSFPSNIVQMPLVAGTCTSVWYFAIVPSMIG